MGKKGKIIGVIVGAVVVLGIIGNCVGNTSPSTDTKSATPKQTQTQQAPQPAPTPAPAPQPKQNTNKQDFTDWWNQMQGPFANLNGDVSTVTNIIMEGANNSNIITTNSYRDRVHQACDKMSQDAQTVLNIPTPSNPQVAAMHNEIIQGVQQVKYVADTLPTGVDTLNVGVINNCTKAFQNSSTHFKNATDLLADFKNNNN